MGGTKFLINKAKDFKLARVNKAKGLFDDDIRAQAAYHFIMEEFNLKDEIEYAEEALSSFKEDMDDFKDMMEQNPNDSKIEKSYIQFRNRINEHKMDVFMKNIHGVIMSKEINVYRISNMVIPYEGYVFSATEDDIRELFIRKCYNNILDDFDDITDPQAVLYSTDILHTYIQKYQSEIFDADKMIDFLSNDSEEKNYHKFEIMTNPQEFFDGYDREDPLTYPTNKDIQDKIREAIEFSVYSEGLNEALINIVQGYGEDPSDYMLSLDEIMSLIIEKNTPEKLFKDYVNPRDININRYEHKNRVFYITLLNKFDKEIFV